MVAETVNSLIKKFPSIEFEDIDHMDILFKVGDISYHCYSDGSGLSIMNE